ncbi:MAG: hypothetical protein LUC17_05180 [Oscillospiraceae bacterium]|nr:hypothetical protein [Oscillospiraceae bacterium]
MSETPFYVKLADRTIRITPLTPNLIHFCADYLVAEPLETDIDFSVAITREVIAAEQARAKALLAKGKAPWLNTSEAYLEPLALARQAATVLLDCDVLLVHGSCLSLDGEGYMFVAPSGVGKSTHAALWREQFGERVVMINDDRPYLKVTDGGVFAYGAPWNGAHHLDTNTCVPLKGLCLLAQDEMNHIEPITLEEAYPWLFRQTWRPEDAAGRAQVLSLLERLGRQVDLYRLRCNMEPEAALIACEGMRGTQRE